MKEGRMKIVLSVISILLFFTVCHVEAADTIKVGAIFAKSGKIAFENTEDFSHFIQQVKSHVPDIVFLPGPTKISAYILKQVHQQGIQTTFLGGDCWNDSMYKIAGEAVFSGQALFNSA